MLDKLMLASACADWACALAETAGIPSLGTRRALEKKTLSTL